MAWSCEDCTYLLYVWLAFRVAATLRPFREARYTPCRRRRRAQCYQVACCRTTTKPRFRGALTVVVVHPKGSGKSTPWLVGRLQVEGFWVKGFWVEGFYFKVLLHMPIRRVNNKLVHTTTNNVFMLCIVPSYVSTQDWKLCCKLCWKLCWQIGF